MRNFIPKPKLPTFKVADFFDTSIHYGPIAQLD